MNVHFLPAPRSLTDLDIPEILLRRLAMKFMLVQGLSTASELVKEIKVTGGIVTAMLEDAQEMALVEVLGQRIHGITAEMTYALTKKGHEFAQESLSQSQYLGPAPVSLESYRRQVQIQTIANEQINIADLVKCFSELVIPEEMLYHLGPAINSARTLLLHGAPGNGKSSIATAIVDSFQQTIFVPYAIEVDSQIIKIYDTTVHTKVAPPQDEDEADAGQKVRLGAITDPRWVNCNRPIVITGGELTLDMLDLIFDPHAKFYEAPLQLKATGGVFVVDDFGRQRVDPRLVLNRWIVPLERRQDYLALHTGKKFPVPFDELVIFSTNLPPKDLLDEATMRRIYYKLEIGPPSRDDYCVIMKRECDRRGLTLSDDIITFLFDEYYVDDKIPLARYHPRFIVDQVMAFCEFQQIPPRLHRKLVREALKNLYV